MAYNKDTDYQSLINQAVASGDYKAAAQYEQLRNEKIADLDASGTNKWNATTTNNYSQYLKTAPADYAGSSTGVGVYTTDQSSIRDQMNANSIAWWSADDATKKQLEAQNKLLAAQLGSGVTFNSQTGYWSGSADEPEILRPSFDYSGYVSSNPQPTFESSYNTRIDDLLNQILNRESFSYDVETDPLYQQYRTQYNREGNRSMNDTLAAVASNAGGMNSYAVTAAQQANDYYASQLTDKIPELYQIAYEMYLEDIDQQVRDLGLLQDMDSTQYSRYRDTMSDWRDDRDFAYNMYRDDMSDYQWDTTFDYNAGRDEIADSRYESEAAYSRAMDLLNVGVIPDDATLQAAGISAETAAAILAPQNVSYYGAGSFGEFSGDSSGSSSGGGSGGLESLFLSSGSGSSANKTEKESTVDSITNGVNNIINSSETEDGGDVELNWGSMNALGLGPVSASYVAEIASYGGIVEDGKGNVYWADGWNAQNYKQKMEQAQKGGNLFPTLGF